MGERGALFDGTMEDILQSVEQSVTFNKLNLGCCGRDDAPDPADLFRTEPPFTVNRPGATPRFTLTEGQLGIPELQIRESFMSL